METPLDTLNAKNFSAHLNTRFKTQAPSGAPTELELIEVDERDNLPQVELFLLRFRGPHSPRLAQKIYRLEHEKLGEINIFLTAISGDEEGVCYECVFNRFRKKASS